MPLSGALFSSVSGLDSTSTAISVIGDNIANVNTTGFKARRTEFADVLGQSISTAGGFSQIGAGAKVSDIRSLFTQGTFETTSRPTDVAIEGRGFFIADGPQGRVYTRAGIFNFDDNGFLVNPEGRFVQGYGIDPVTGLSNGLLGDIQIATALAPPRTTSTIDLSVNLFANDPIQAGGFDPADPATASHAVPIDVYDSLGNRHSMSVFFTKTGSNTWEWNAALAPADTTTAPANPTDPWVVQGAGTLTFDTSGTLTGSTGTSFAANFSGGAAAGQAFTLGFTNAGVPTTQFGGSSGTGASTSSASASQTNSFSQDGFAAGTLQSINIDQQGYLAGSFSNGETIPLAQLALANFPNLEGLQGIGNTNLIETRESGQPLIGQPQAGGLGSIRASSLEQSNVDLATEFVRLIINQRAFQANTRTISTTNELLGDLVQLGR
jgi:flagellar hook protein FlgE